MRSVLVVTALTTGALACKGSSDRPAAAPPTPPAADAALPLDGPVAPVALDAAPPALDPEDARRAGQPTGLGGGEPPAVVTEALIVAIAEGKVPAERLVDPRRGFVEQRSLPGAGDRPVPDVRKRHCGARAAIALRGVAKELVAEEREWATREPDVPADQRSHVITCSNEFLATPDPHFGGKPGDDGAGVGGQPFAYALCRSPGAGEWDAAYELVFTTDPERGVRAVGLLVWEVGAMPDWARFAAEALKDPGC